MPSRLLYHYKISIRLDLGLEEAASKMEKGRGKRKKFFYYYYFFRAVEGNCRLERSLLAFTAVSGRPSEEGCTSKHLCLPGITLNYFLLESLLDEF